MTTEQQLPKGWEIKRLGDVLKIQNGYAFKSMEFIKENPKNTHIPLIRQSQLVGNIVDLSDCVFLDKKYLSDKKNYIVNKGDILIGMSGSIGKVSFYEDERPALLNQRVGKLNLYNHDTFQKDFFAYLLINLEQSIIQTAKGMGVQNISSKDIEQLRIPIPPFDTQQAIVNKIESLFDEIDEGIGRLKTAAQQIQQYRQSLLKNAFNGELTKEWRSKHADTLPSENELLAQIQTTREQHHAQQLADWQTAVSQWEQNGKEGKKPSKPKAPTQAVKFEENFADLPRGWGTIKINQVAEIFTGATPLKSNANYYENGSIPWVTSGSLNNEFVDSADSFVTDLALKETNLKLLPKHTLLVAMYGEGKTRGKCSELLIEATTNQAIAGIVLNEKYPISRKFLKFYMFKNYADIRRQSSGGVQPNLNLSLVGNIIFPLPCLAEQTQIVAILETKLNACDQLAAELAKQLKQAELLKQAVLKAAFSGSLLDK